MPLRRDAAMFRYFATPPTLDIDGMVNTLPADDYYLLCRYC